MSSESDASSPELNAQQTQQSKHETDDQYLLKLTKEEQCEEIKVCLWKNTDDGYKWEGYGSRKLTDGLAHTQAHTNTHKHTQTHTNRFFPRFFNPQPHHSSMFCFLIEFVKCVCVCVCALAFIRSSSQKSYYRCMGSKAPTPCEAKKVLQEHPSYSHTKQTTKAFNSCFSISSLTFFLLLCVLPQTCENNCCVLVCLCRGLASGCDHIQRQTQPSSRERRHKPQPHSQGAQTNMQFLCFCFGFVQ